MMVNYNRCLYNDLLSKPEYKRATDSFLFEYNAEIFYYFFFSSKDIIDQIMRVYYDVDTSEHNFHPHNNKKFLGEIEKYPLVENALIVFQESIKTSSGIRNAFTHKFTPTQRDHRHTYKEDNRLKFLEMSRGDIAISPESIVKNTKELLVRLQTLMDILTEEII